MKRLTDSLAPRLIAAVLATQLIVITGLMLFWMVFSHSVSHDDLSAATSQRRVAESITLDPAGAPRIEPSSALRAYQARRPQLAYAVYLDGRLVPGSSQQLAHAISPRGWAAPGANLEPAPTLADLYRHFPDLQCVQLLAECGDPVIALGEGQRANVSMFPVHGIGTAVVVTSGNRLGLDDLPTALLTLIPRVMKLFGSAVLATVLVLPLMLRRALQPLTRAANAASGIGLETLDQRLSPDGVPKEIQPFVTAINQLLERLERGVSRQQLFVANAAHELRTPVAILCARLDSLGDSPATRDLRRDATRLGLMVDQLLAAFRMQGQTPADWRALDLVQQLRELISDMAPLALRSGRAIALEAASPSEMVLGQADGLRSALANLLDNALRAEPAGGTVIVRMEASTSSVTVDVVDHGPGVEESDRENIFEPFWRREGQWSGTGLGLAIARRISKGHGGSLQHLPTEGGGATFRMRVRRAPAGRSIDSSACCKD